MKRVPAGLDTSETPEPSQPAPMYAPQPITDDALDDALRMTFPASDPVAVDPSRQSTIEGRKVRRGDASSTAPMEGG